MSDAARIKAEESRSYTYADYKSWELDEGERFELINGEAYALAAPTDQHQAISVEICRQLANFLQNKPCKVRSSPYDVRLFYKEDESDSTVVQPDISVICDEKKRGPEGCRGAPDLVVEILSPSSQSYDWVGKFNLYLKAGVQEYWIVAPDQKVVQIFVLQTPQTEGTASKTYLGTVYGGDLNGAERAPSAVLEGFSLDLSMVFS